MLRLLGFSPWSPVKGCSWARLGAESRRRRGIENSCTKESHASILAWHWLFKDGYACLLNVPARSVTHVCYENKECIVPSLTTPIIAATTTPFQITQHSLSETSIFSRLARDWDTHSFYFEISNVKRNFQWVMPLKNLIVRDDRLMHAIMPKSAQSQVTCCGYFAKLQAGKFVCPSLLLIPRFCLPDFDLPSNDETVCRFQPCKGVCTPYSVRSRSVKRYSSGSPSSGSRPSGSCPSRSSGSCGRITQTPINTVGCRRAMVVPLKVSPFQDVAINADHLVTRVLYSSTQAPLSCQQSTAHS